MAISSNEISNIISGQVGMFSASAQYAQAISSQYGFQSTGSVGINDPRDAGNAQLQAGNMGATMARAPGFAMGGLGLMAMMNYAPRMFDPFTMGLNMVRRGHQVGGMAGAIGMGGAALGIGMGIGAVGSFATNNMVTGAQNRGLLNQQISSIFPNMGVGGLNMMAGQVESMSRQGMGSIRELASLMQQGAATGALDTGSLNTFSTSFRKLINNVRQVATVLNSSMTEAGQALQSVKAIGVKSNEAAAFLGAARGIGTAAHMTPGQMMGVAQSGSQFAFSAGIDRKTGALGAMTSAGVYGLAQQSELYGVDSGSQGRYTQAATRFLLSSRGRTILGAMMTKDGEFDESRARMIASGAYSGDQLREMHRRNMSSPGMRRMLNNRSTELAGQFISQFGPEAISGGLGALTSGPGQDTEGLQKALTGLNRRDLDNMRQLAAAAPMLKQKLIDEARRGFQEGQQRVSGMQMMGIAFDRLIKPMKDQFREFGASMTQAAGEAMQSVTQEMVGKKQGTPNYQEEWNRMHARLSGNTALAASYNMSGMNFQWEMNKMPGRAEGWASFLNYMPGIFRAGAMPEGATLDSMPGGGFTTLDPNDAMTIGAIGAASRFNAFPGGRNVFGAMGAGTQALGRGMDRIAMAGYARGPGGAPRYPWMGFTGVNTIRGAARMPGGVAKTFGVLGRGVGKGLGLLSLPMMAYGLGGATAQASRAMGYSGISEGAIAGNNARLVHALRRTGVLSPTMMGFHDITDTTRTNFPGTPVEGIFGEGGARGGKGYQGFLTPEGEEAIQALFSKEGVDGGDNALDKIAAGLNTDRQGAREGINTLMRSEKFQAANIEGRLKILRDGLSGQGINLTPTEAAQIGFRTEGFMGDKSFDARWDAAADLGFQNDGSNVRKFNEWFTKGGEGGGRPHLDPSRFDTTRAEQIKAFGKIMSTQGNHLRMLGAQDAFLRGNKDFARSELLDMIGADTIVRGDSAKKDLAAQIEASFTDTGDEPTTAIGFAVREAGQFADDNKGRYRGFGTSPIAAADRARGIMHAWGKRAAANQKDAASIRFGLEQGRRFLGRVGTGTDANMEGLKDPESVEETMIGMRKSLVGDLWNMNQRGELPEAEAIDFAMQGYMGAGAIGQDMASVTGNASMLIRDWNKVKGNKDRNAMFLNKAAARMGLRHDFTQFKNKNDLAFLRGGEGADRTAITTKLQTYLRQFGAQKHKLETGREASGAEAEAAAQSVVDNLAGDANDNVKAIEALSTMRPPAQPGSAGATSGGLQRTIQTVDAALQDFATRLNAFKVE